MIFGIKTKKDKKIEELQTELDTLKMCAIPIKLSKVQCDIETLESKLAVNSDDILFTISPDRREDIIQQELVKQFFDDVFNYIEFTAEYDFRHEQYIYRARLKVVKDK